MRHTKTVRTGKFAKAGENYKEGDRVTVLDEGTKLEGQFGVEVVHKCRMVNGDELSMRFNKTTINNMIDAFGDESKAWVGQEVKVWRVLQNVQGKMIRVTYLSHPDADIDEQGNFVIPGRPVPADADTGIDYPTEEVNPDDITFD